MHLIIDCRENKLIELFKTQNIEFSIESLQIGDIVIRDINKKDIIIIERKSVSDMAASISDGRYNEQSYRLNACDTANHNIVYLIEGDIRQQTRFSRITPSVIYSSLTSISLFKGFSLMITHDVAETSKYIQQLYNKISKNYSEGKELYSSSAPVGEYIDVMKNSKKSNVTSGNVAEIMLSQIPSVSKNIAKVVMAEYHTLGNLMAAISNGTDKLHQLKTKDTNGKERKISKTSAENIKTFLI